MRLSRIHPEYRDTLLVSLGTIGHEAVLPILVPFIEGSHVPRDSSHVRLVTIMSLRHVVEKHSHVLLPIFVRLVTNPAETTAVRMTALHVVLTTTGMTATHMQKLAVMTWHERDPEMVKFVYSALWSLSHTARHHHPFYCPVAVMVMVETPGCRQLITRKAIMAVVEALPWR